MPIDADFVEAIADRVAPKTLVLTANGKDFVSSEVFNPPLPEIPPHQAFPTVQLWSLQSLVDYVKANRDKIDLAGSLIVAGHDTAALKSSPIGELKARDTFASAHSGAVPPGTEYCGIEDMRVTLLSRFQRTPEAENVITFLSNVTDSAVVQSEDDGFSQQVTAKAGVASRAVVKVPSPVRLVPIRTFIEVAQPSSEFILRLKPVKDQLPQVALFEIPSNWRREAAVNVKAFLDSKMADWPDADRIPVFA